MIWRVSFSRARGANSFPYVDTKSSYFHAATKVDSPEGERHRRTKRAGIVVTIRKWGTR